MKWITIKLMINEGKKTDTFEVSSIYDCCSLGLIKWKATWRRYTFFPYPNTCFEWDCMRDIADFCEQETKKYKEKWMK